MTSLLRSGLTAAMMVAVVLVGLRLAGPAAAVPRCAGECPSLSVNTARPAAGTPVTVTGDDFGSWDRVSVTLHGATSPLGSAHTNAVGAFRTTFTLPSHMAGRHPIVASDPITAQQVRQVLMIGARNAAAVGHGTSNTTSSARSERYARVAIIGLGALAFVLLSGGGLLLLTRRNQHISV